MNIAEIVVGRSMYIVEIVHSFFMRTSKFCLRLIVLNFFSIFKAEMFLYCPYFLD